MMPEELYGRVMLDLARSEGHKPMHLVRTAADAHAESWKRRGKRGETAQKVRALWAEGKTLKQAARALGVDNMTVYRHAQRLGIKFVDGRT